MKWWFIKCLLAVSPACPAASFGPATADTPILTHTAGADTILPSKTSEPDFPSPTVKKKKQTAYERHTSRMKRDWAKRAPNQTTVQFAGSIGVCALGVGWHYGRGKRWETELLWGYVPKCNGSEKHQTLTAKQRFVPWLLPLFGSHRWEAEPLTTGIFASTIFGEGFWRHQPSKYTKGYYGFNTKLRYNVFIGQRLRYNIPRRHRNFSKSISLYYELSTCDLYVVSSVPNRHVGFTDILSLALGLRMELF